MILYKIDSNKVFVEEVVISDYATWGSDFITIPPPITVSGEFAVYDSVWSIVTSYPVIAEVPQSVTKVQAMRAMKQTDVDTVAGTSMWNNFQALLASNVDANDEWLLALDLQRNHPLVLALTPALGKTDAQIDELFVLANAL